MVLEAVRNEQYYGVDGPPQCPLYQWKIVRKDLASRVQREWAAVRVPPLFSLVLSHVHLSAYVISASVGYRSSQV